MKQESVKLNLSQSVLSDILNQLFFGNQTNDELLVAFDEAIHEFEYGFLPLNQKVEDHVYGKLQWDDNSQ